MTAEELFELRELETSLKALDNNWYDTHNLDWIAENEESIKKQIQEIKKAHYIVDADIDLPHYSMENNKCVQRVYYCYTDGSAVASGKNKGKSGFGTYFPNYGKSRRAYSKGFYDGKTGRVEVMALYYAIKAMPRTSDYEIMLRVYTDSQYVQKTFTENRLQKWIANNWIISSWGGKLEEVKNKDLWMLIVDMLNERSYLRLDLQHIKSHQVEKAKTKEEKEALLRNPHIRGNMVADALADYKRHEELITAYKL